MNDRFRFHALLLSAAVLAPVITGCTDQEAEQRAQIQQRILDANIELQKANLGAPAPGTDEFDQAHKALEKVVADASGIRADDAGQQAAKSMLLANALTQLATLDLAKAETLEQLNEGVTNRVSEIASRGSDLYHRVLAIESVDLTPSRAALDKARAGESGQLTTLNDQMAELQGPIQDRRQRNEADKEEANTLRTQANDLMRQARESGYSAGFDTFEQAIKLQRQADQVEHEIAQREIELDLNLEAEHNFLALKAKNAQNAIDSVDAADTALAAFSQGNAADNDQSRQTLDAMRKDLDTLLDEYETRVSKELDPVYAEAEQRLENAAREAQSAATKAGREGGGAANMLAARINENLGKLNWSRARGLAAGRDMYQMVLDANDALGVGTEIADDVDRINTEYAQAIEDAKAAFQQTQQILGRITGGGQKELNEYKQNVQLALDSLEGKTQPPKPAATTGGAGGATAPAAAPSGTGFGTPEELLQYLQAQLAQGHAGALIEYTHAETPNAQKYLELSRGTIAALERFTKAAEGKFGSQVDPMLQGLKSGMAIGAGLPDPTSAKVVEQSDDHIVYGVSQAGQSGTFGLVKIGGAWFVDGDRLMSSIPGGDSTIAAMTTMMESMTGSLNAISQKIESGEVSNMQQLNAAFQQIAQEMMKNLPGQPSKP